MMSNHPFHLVTNSPWPLISAINLMNLLSGLIIWFNQLGYLNMLMSFYIFLISIFQWWRDIIRESTFQGFHTLKVLKLLKFSMILFIISEVFFFISLFWTYLHSSISLSIEIGMMWPPKGIISFNPFSIPLLNSMILIFSGMTLTWSHQFFLENKFIETHSLLELTIASGVYFSIQQYYEYMESYFCMNDGMFGSIFFMLTGFHGLHVIIGILMLYSCLYRMENYHFSKIHHFNFEAAAWYWHFVDVVWLFLYILIYWWIY